MVIFPRKYVKSRGREPVATAARRVLPFVFFVFCCCPTAASGYQIWTDDPGGATRDFRSFDARISWNRPLGDWQDRDGKLHGDNPYTVSTIGDAITDNVAYLDVAALVRQWVSGDIEYSGFFIRGIRGTSSVLFSTREGGRAPTLTIQTSDGYYSIEATADTYLDASTFKSLGGLGTMTVSTGQSALIGFDLDSIPRTAVIRKAVLALAVDKMFGGQSLVLGVFRVASTEPGTGTAADNAGLSAAYHADAGIGADADVIFAEGFADANWKTHLLDRGTSGTVVDLDPGNGLRPICGRSLQATIPAGENKGLNMSIAFPASSQLTEAYARYYLRFGDDWNQTVSGGKLPGFAGTYGKAGWGGRKPNGYDGWSARGSFSKTVTLKDAGHTRLTSIGSYVYHLAQPDDYGSNWVWDDFGAMPLENNRWYSIEQYIKLNDPGSKNGALQAWIDGKLVLDRTDLEFRKSNELLIEEFWLNVYHGGTAPSPSRQSLYIDNIVIARRYIGPGSWPPADGADKVHCAP